MKVLNNLICVSDGSTNTRECEHTARYLESSSIFSVRGRDSRPPPGVWAPDGVGGMVSATLAVMDGRLEEVTDLRAWKSSLDAIAGAVRRREGAVKWRTGL